MNYTVKLEGKRNERCAMDFNNLKDARKYAKRLAILKKYANDRMFANEVVVYCWNDNDSEMTELDRKNLSEMLK